MADRYAWVGGPIVQMPGQVDRIPDFDPRSGAHLWTMLLAFKVDPSRWSDGGEVTPTLDHENLLSISGPGCYYCEASFTPTLAGRRCKGKP